MQQIGEAMRFQVKTDQVHKALREWHLGRFSQIEIQLQNCKKALIFFDMIEEKRVLDTREFNFRLKIRARAYELAQIVELRWMQRSRVTWLQSGDKNTRYFHAYASARARKNAVEKIQLEDGSECSDKKEIANIFCDHMKSILGTQGEVLQFDSTKLYPRMEDLIELGEPFTELEIECAVRQLAPNKASGPDGLPSEFIKTSWPLIKEEMNEIFDAFFHNRLDLSCINKANMVFVPKKEKPEDVGDFRPISIINLVPKLISKVLSNRLRPKL